MANTEGVKTFLAGAALVAHRRVALKSGTTTTPPEVEYTALNGAGIGVTQGDAASGEPVAVKLDHHNGTIEMTAGEAFAVGASLYATADGKVVDTAGTGPIIGVALEAATADGDIVEVLPSLARN